MFYENYLQFLCELCKDYRGQITHLKYEGYVMVLWNWLYAISNNKIGIVFYLKTFKLFIDFGNSEFILIWIFSWELENIKVQMSPTLLTDRLIEIFSKLIILKSVHDFLILHTFLYLTHGIGCNPGNFHGAEQINNDWFYEFDCWGNSRKKTG